MILVCFQMRILNTPSPALRWLVTLTQSQEISGDQMSTPSLPPPTANLAAAILGVWKLTSRVDLDAAGAIHIDPFLGRDPLGMLCFASGHFSAQFMKRDRSQQDDATQRTQASNNTAGVNGYDAYFGTYTIDQAAGTLTTRLEGSISPENIGRTFVRDARVVNEELIIRLQTTAVDGTHITRTNTFSRLS